LLRWFVSNCKHIYGDYFTVYNVHSLIHITEDVLYHNSSLNDICAFKFENFMQDLQKCMKNSYNPLTQMLRLSERESNITLSEKKKNILQLSRKVEKIPLFYLLVVIYASFKVSLTKILFNVTSSKTDIVNPFMRTLLTRKTLIFFT